MTSHKRFREISSDLAENVEVAYALWQVVRQVEPLPPVQPAITPAEARIRLRRGVSLLYGQKIIFKWCAFATLYREACRLGALHRPDLVPHFQALKKLLDDRSPELNRLVDRYLADGQASPGDKWDHPRSEAATVRPDVLNFVLSHALSPFLRAFARTLAPLFEGKRWQRGHCPVCGGQPDLAVLDNDTGARRLVCSRCDGAWLFPRRQRPFCAASVCSEPIYSLDEEKQYRLDVCRTCHHSLRELLYPLTTPSQGLNKGRLSL